LPASSATNERSILSSSTARSRRIGERAVAGAVVVDRDGDPERAQGGDGARAALAVGHQRALGDLDGERVGRQAVGVEQRADAGRQGVVEEVARGEVDGDRQVEAGGTPGLRLGHGEPQHGVGELARAAALLDERQERVGEQQAAVGVLPAHERLDADDAARAHVALGLVVEHELVARERADRRRGSRRPPARGTDGSTWNWDRRDVRDVPGGEEEHPEAEQRGGEPVRAGRRGRARHMTPGSASARFASQPSRHAVWPAPGPRPSAATYASSAARSAALARARLVVDRSTSA
jgi:hypothetical protein